MPSNEMNPVLDVLSDTQTLKISIGSRPHPSIGDIAFASIDYAGNPGELIKYVFDELGYDANEQYFDAKDLEKGYRLVEPSGLTPVILVVTNKNFGTLELKQNLDNALNAHEGLIANKTLWVPLMGSGKGGLKEEESLEATLIRFRSFSLDVKGKIHIILSIPYDRESKQYEFLYRVAKDSADYLMEQQKAKEEQKAKKVDSKKTVRKSGPFTPWEAPLETPKISPDEPVPEPDPKKDPLPSDSVPMHLDSPSDEDRLSRRPFANALALHMKKIWRENKSVSGDDSKADQAFMLHIYGQWGSGKTSLLNFLKTKLKENETGKKDEQWIVIDFNSWQHQHIDPPWWPLLDNIFRQSKTQVPYFKAKWINFAEHYRRLETGNAPLILSIFLLFVIIIVSLMCGVTINDVLGFDLKGVPTLFGAVTTIWAFMTGFGKTLLPGSSKAAKACLEFTPDPMRRLSVHFDKLLKSIERPVAVFIDDLDRCRPEYVVGLLEGIQTMFRNSQVLYVVAADRKWISTCFEEQYESFSKTRQRPGHCLGYMFVEKAFQLSTRIPRVSQHALKEYWEYLLYTKKDGAPEKIVENEEKAKREFAELSTEDQILDKINEQIEKNKDKNEGSIPAHVIRNAAMHKLSERKISEKIEHALEDYADLMEPNPRAMKRLVNYYSVYRNATLAEGETIERETLVRWLVLSNRWPLLAEFFENNPDKIEFLGKSSKSDFKGMPDDLVVLFDDAEVIKVKGKLDAKAIRQCTGHSLSEG